MDHIIDVKTKFSPLRLPAVLFFGDTIGIFFMPPSIIQHQRCFLSYLGYHANFHVPNGLSFARSHIFQAQPRPLLIQIFRFDIEYQPVGLKEQMTLFISFLHILFIIFSYYLTILCTVHSQRYHRFHSLSLSSKIINSISSTLAECTALYLLICMSSFPTLR